MSQALFKTASFLVLLFIVIFTTPSRVQGIERIGKACKIEGDCRGVRCGILQAACVNDKCVCPVLKLNDYHQFSVPGRLKCERDIECVRVVCAPRGIPAYCVDKLCKCPVH
ncbi:hypothetical protein ACFE04_024004 [Oxalis oulophora]